MMFESPSTLLECTNWTKTSSWHINVGIHWKHSINTISQSHTNNWPLRRPMMLVSWSLAVTHGVAYPTIYDIIFEHCGGILTCNAPCIAIIKTSTRHSRWFVECHYSWGKGAAMTNVWGEPVFSVMAAGWFCEKSGWMGKVEDVKPMLHMNCEIGGFHSVWFI
jgi:hypothetical protein